MSVWRGPWRVPVGLAYLAFILVGVNAGVGGVLLPAQIADYRVDMATIGITFFFSGAGFLAGGATSGVLIQRFGMRALLLGATGLYVVAAFYTATRPPFWALVAVQLLVGYGTGVLESVLNVFLADLPSATTLLNHLHAFFGVGALLGPLLAAWMLGFVAWPVVWLVLGLAGLPLIVGFFLAYPRKAGEVRNQVPDIPPAEIHDTPAAPLGDAVLVSAPAGAPAKPRGGLLTAALRMPAVMLASIFLSVYVGLEVSVGNWGYTFLVQEHAQAHLIAGYTVSGYWLGLTAGRFLISPLAARAGLSAMGMTFVCLAGVTAGVGLIWAAPAGAVAATGFVLLGFFLGPLFPTAMAVVPALIESRLVPTAIGVINGLSVVGGALFPWMAGAIAEGVGVWTLMPFTLTLALVQLMVWWLLSRRMTASPA
ncbi:MFS transporter [Sphaerisporangium aureirubrum]|uniref:MFS transporter n=1 Tax=Sphaerisporangium aureirubrum TaxID=1544736 RepID=A0ABW1NQ64_9ACTN